MKTLRLSVVALVASSSACDTGGGGGGANSNSGGYVDVEVTLTEGLGSAEFYSDFRGKEFSLEEIPREECADFVTLLGDGSTPTYEDVGPIVSATSGSTSITLARDIGADYIYYDSPDVPGAPADSDYTIAIGGTPLGTVHVPGLPDPVSMNGMTVSWTITGAQEVILAVVDSAEIWLCRTADDGSYALPPAVTNAIPTGFVTFNSENSVHVMRNGRDLTLIGSVSAESVSY